MTTPVQIPADIDRPDTVLGPLTARQLAILATTGLVLYLAWTLTRDVVLLPVFLVIAAPLAVTVTVLVLGRRDGVSLDRLAWAALCYRLNPRHHVSAPEGLATIPDWASIHDNQHDSTSELAPLQLPARTVIGTGIIDLGVDGVAIIARASTVNFTLRTTAEQDALVAVFARYLHSLTVPVQILIRTDELDLSEQVTRLREHAGDLPDPGLEVAALEHASYLESLADQADLLCRRVFLIFREPLSATSLLREDNWAGLARILGKSRHATGRDRADVTEHAAARLVRRVAEATELLAAAGITVTALDAEQATAVLASSCRPDTLVPVSANMAAADAIITLADPGGNADEHPQQPEPDPATALPGAR